MTHGQISTDERTPALGWARRLLTRQLDTLSRLAGAAMRAFGSALQLSAGPTALALQRAVKTHTKAAWALRLIDALRLKLMGDLQRVDRGEVPITSPPLLEPRARKAEPAPAPPPEPPLSQSERMRRELEQLRAMMRGEISLDEMDFDEEDFDDEDFESPDRESFGLGLSGPRPGEFDAILKRPVDEILALIAKELGLPPEWLSQAEQAWEEEQEESFSSPAQRGRWIEAQPRDGGGAPELPPLDAKARPPPPYVRFL